MGLKDKEMKWQIMGIAHAVNILEKSPNYQVGYNELKKELQFRKKYSLPITVPREDVNNCVMSIITEILSAYPVAIAKVLNDDFGFGGERLTRFMNKFHDAIESFGDVDTFGESYCTFSDYATELVEKYGKNGLAFHMAKIFEIDSINEKAKDRRIDKEALLTWLYEHGHVEAAVDFQNFIDGENTKEDTKNA